MVAYQGEDGDGFGPCWQMAPTEVDGHLSLLQEGRQQGLEQGREQALRQTFIGYIETRFPALTPLAQQQTSAIKDTDVLQRVIFKLFAVQTAEEAKGLCSRWAMMSGIIEEEFSGRTMLTREPRNSSH